MLDLLAIDHNKAASPVQAGRKAESSGDFFSELLGASGAADDPYDSPRGDDLGASDAGTREPAAPEQTPPPADEPSRDEPADASVRDDRTQEAEDPAADRTKASDTAAPSDDGQNRDGAQAGPDDGRGQPANPTDGETAAQQSAAKPATAGDQIPPQAASQPSGATPQQAQPAAAAAPVPGTPSAPETAPTTAAAAGPTDPGAESLPGQTATTGIGSGQGTANQVAGVPPAPPAQGTLPADDRPPGAWPAEDTAPAGGAPVSKNGESMAETAPKGAMVPGTAGDVAPGEAAARSTAPELAAAAQQGNKNGERKAGGQGTTPAPGGTTAAPDAGQSGQATSNGQAAQNATSLAEQLASTTAAGRNFNALVQGMAANGGDAPAPLQPGGGETVPTQFQAQQLAAGRGLDGTSGLNGRTAAASPSGQVAVQIQKAVTAKLSRFSISLEPAELGRVDVRLEFVRDGQVRATITAERPETLELLQKDAQGLERTLRDAGANTKELSLNFDLSGDGRREAARNGSDANSGDGQANDETANDEADGEESLAEQQGRERRVDGLVDIQV